MASSASNGKSPSRLRVPSSVSEDRQSSGQASPSRIRQDMKYVIVTGGVASGIGKGITISSIGVLLKCMGLRVTSIKIDPYLNIDAGTMSPFEHGEVFVLKDGGEGDLDLGNYERFLDIELTKDHNITTGKVYNQVLQRERRGDYLGKTVQVVPHVTNAIQEWIERVAYRPVDGVRGSPDVCLVEVGGTVGDIESMIFLEALRQFQFRAKKENCCFVHVSLVPSITAVGEQKTKPSQHGVKQLMMAGLQPDLLVCRSSMPLEPGIAEKLAMFCHVNKSNVLSVHDVPNIYHVPNMLQEQHLPTVIMQSLGMNPPIEISDSPMLRKWNDMAVAVDTFDEEVVIAVVGKYTGLSDAYLSVIKALKHSAIAAARKLKIKWVEAQQLEPSFESQNETGYSESWATVRGADGVLVPGGFGNRGVEGKILAANYARTSKTPYLGVCLGMQCAVIEFARNVCGLDKANSTEFDDKAEHQAIIFMPEINPNQMGGTMRLGERVTLLKEYDGVPHTIATTVYGDVAEVEERHRHRYEVNPSLVPQMEAKGLMFTGVDERGQRMEIIELRESDHPFYLGTQYHPEFKTVVGKPSPPFYGFILAASGQYKGHGQPIKSTEEFRNLLQSPAMAKAKKRGSSSASSSPSKRSRH